MALDRSRAQSVSEEHELIALLRRQGVSCVLLSSDEDLVGLGEGPGDGPELVLIDTGYMTSMEITRCVEACGEIEAQAIALVPRNRVPSLDVGLRLSDFVVSPPDPDELVIRAQRALRVGQEAEEDSHIIRAGDLQIDTSSYEVTIRRQPDRAEIQGVRAAQAVGGKSGEGVLKGRSAQPDLGV